MKYLSDYMNDKQTALFDKYCCFFAFSQKQFNEGIEKHPHIEKWCNMGNGLIAPSQYTEEIYTNLDKIYKDSILQDCYENGIDNIIIRELLNHEYCITYDLAAVIETLKDYPITEKMIKLVLKDNWKKVVDDCF